MKAAYICFRSGVENLRLSTVSANEVQVVDVEGREVSVCDEGKKSRISGSVEASYNIMRGE